MLAMIEDGKGGRDLFVPGRQSSAEANGSGGGEAMAGRGVKSLLLFCCLPPVTADTLTVGARDRDSRSGGRRR
jgi:hypothetical protein